MKYTKQWQLRLTYRILPLFANWTIPNVLMKVHSPVHRNALTVFSEIEELCLYFFNYPGGCASISACARVRRSFGCGAHFFSHCFAAALIWVRRLFEYLQQQVNPLLLVSTVTMCCFRMSFRGRIFLSGLLNTVLYAKFLLFISGGLRSVVRGVGGRWRESPSDIESQS